MSDANVEATTESPSAPQSTSNTDVAKRQRSSIAFPYMDLGEALSIARAIHGHVGLGTCTSDQLAAWIGQSPSSSAFRLRIAATRLFGVADSERLDSIRLTEIGQMAVDNQREREGRARAFLSVQLYRAIFDKYRGGNLPPTAALEREMVTLGVAATLTDRARPVMERSAEQAGFYESGRDRLVMPGFTPSSGTSPDPTGDKPSNIGAGKGGSGGGAGEDPPRHPLIEGLFQSLPKDGEDWTFEEATDWLQAAAYNLRFAYRLKGGLIKVEFVPSPRPTQA